MGESTILDTKVLQRNPFPGVRSFTSAEDKYFFGREESVKELLDLLLKNRFVALVGDSGVGKSSLIQSGIIPALLTEDKQEWVPITVRPGHQPLINLLKGFQRVFPKKYSDEDMDSFLSDDGNLIDWINEKGLGSHRYMIVVDHFEELFRSGLSGKKSGKNREASRLVNLLLHAVKSDLTGVHVIISIRSEFIEACATYHALAEQMDRSKYLLPPMTGESLSRAIMEPIRKAGASVEDGFVEYLLDDLKKVKDKLPLLQHALMRTWDHWAHRKSRDIPISISDYKAVGTIRNALGSHLDEIYESLENRQKVICERMFKTITARSDTQNGFCKPASLGTIARIAQCTVEEAADVVEVFRKPGRAFLSPYTSVALTQNSIIEPSHESLIRNWERLATWVDEEAESIKMYTMLSEASALYQQGRTELLKPPELQRALRWRETQQPTPAWGIQYNPAFERAMVFLNTSEEEYHWQEERKTILKRRRLIINRTISVVMVMLVVVLAIIFFGSRNRSAGESEQDQQGEQEYVYTPVEEQEPASAPDPLSEDVSREGAAEPALEEETVPEDDESTTQREERTPQQEEPVRQSREENISRQADRQQTPAQPEATIDVAYQRRVVSIAKDVADKSTRIGNNPDLQGLLAYQAYQLNDRFNGKSYDADIYQGLYMAMKKLISSAYNIYPNVRNTIRSIEWLNGRGSIITASSGGTIMILPGNYKNRASQRRLASTGYNNESLAVSPDERVVAVGTSGGGMLFIDIGDGRLLNQNLENGDIFLFLQNIGNSGSFLSAGTDNRILKWEYGSFEASLWGEMEARPSALAASPDGRRAAVGTRDGRLYEISVNDPANMELVNDFGRNHVRAITYSPGGDHLAVGLLDGSVRILAGSSRRTIASLSGPGARVADLAYSPDGRRLAAASHDGNVYLWNTADWDHPPVVCSDNNGFVLSVCFSGNSRYFYSGSTDFPRLIGRPSGSAQMVSDFCSLVDRNLTRSEWDQYFGGDIPFEETCPGKN